MVYLFIFLIVILILSSYSKSNPPESAGTISVMDQLGRNVVIPPKIARIAALHHLLDEPNSHLDFCNQHRMMNLIHQIVKERGVTALITLHDPNLALYYCDDVVMLREGRLIASGPTKEMMKDHYLRLALGDNIRRDATMNGVQVVVHRNVAG
jgi:ABC-type hemin transport system ATPase subunit